MSEDASLRDEPIYWLDHRPIFPPPELARGDGLLAVGGDLSVPRLLEAYRNGIFPWFEPGQPILWWSPDPRMIFEPDGLHITRSLRSTIRKGRYEVRFDTAFATVIHACGATPRPGQPGSWIGPEMERAYNTLHELGYAHSVESWCGGKLVGGLYGVYLGRCFFGESMFSHQTDASKAALVAAVDFLRARDIQLIDCQLPNDHLARLGGRLIGRAEFLGRLREALRFPTDRSRWTPLL